jgi:L-threonylcarbamoyladenylate synthase
MMDEIVAKAARVVRNGGIILYPTDTIWGIGCDATNRSAVQRIYRLKKRSDRKSMLVLMNEPAMLDQYLTEVPAGALDLLRSSEKPTTIIYPGARNLAANLPARDGSIGIRITGDPFCQKLISQIEKPLVSTSANTSGSPSPLIFNEITEYIRDSVDYVVEWRQQEETPAIPSTIIKLGKGGEVEILRP